MNKRLKAPVLNALDRELIEYFDKNIKLSECLRFKERTKFFFEGAKSMYKEKGIQFTIDSIVIALDKQPVDGFILSLMSVPHELKEIVKNNTSIYK